MKETIMNVWRCLFCGKSHRDGARHVTVRYNTPGGYKTFGGQTAWTYISLDLSLVCRDCWRQRDTESIIDAYHKYLREHPENDSGTRYDESLLVEAIRREKADPGTHDPEPTPPGDPDFYRRLEASYRRLKESADEPSGE
jgi:hypothetical protein